jgi:hypothetical protein
MKEFKNPTADTMMTLMGGLIRRSLGVDWDFATPHFDGAVHLQSAPNLFDDVVPEINQIQTMYDMCMMCITVIYIF